MILRLVGVDVLAGTRGVVDVTVALLGELRRNMEEATRRRDEAMAQHHAHAENLRRDLVDWMREQVGPSVHPLNAAMSELSGDDLLQRLTERPPPWDSDLVTCRTAALALDQAFGPHFSALLGSWYWHRRVGATRPMAGHWARVSPGEPIPLSAAHRKAVRGRYRPALGSLPNEERVDRLPNLCLAPEGFDDAEVTIDFRLATAVGNAQTFTVGVGAPCRDRRDVPLGPFPMGPADASLMQRRLHRVLDLAGEHGVHLLVYPELVSTSELRSTLMEHWLEADPQVQVPLLVPGSEHLTVDGERCNVGGLFGIEDAADLLDGEPVRNWHRKFAPVRHVKDGESWPVEEIDVQPMSVRLHVVGGLKLVVLICRDYAEDGILELLRHLEPDIVVVPAHSPSLDPFETTAFDLVGSCHTETYIANTQRIGRDGRSVAGLAAHPGERDRITHLFAEEDGRRGVGLFLVDGGEVTTAQWVPMVEDVA